jgi:glutamate formiminotransferase/formiminotetrahydrofolate cyclodeaminase
VTPPHVAFEACVEQAGKLGVAVAGSELVGLIPLEAMLAAADYYIEKEGLFVLDERRKIRLVIERLGLSSVSPFKAEERIIEYMIEDEGAEPLASLSVREFVEALGARTAAPGGGSAAALIAAMGAALAAMVGWLTYGRRKFEDVDGAMREHIPPVHQAMQQLIPMIDADTNAFNHYMEAMGLPQDTGAEREARHSAMQAGLKQAIEVPLTTMRIADGSWDAMVELARHINIPMRSDLEVGARALETGTWGAYRNVLINLGDIEDESFREAVTKEAEALVKRASEKSAEVLSVLEAR